MTSLEMPSPGMKYRFIRLDMLSVHPEDQAEIRDANIFNVGGAVDPI
jgi:hypothetical protein